MGPDIYPLRTSVATVFTPCFLKGCGIKRIPIALGSFPHENENTIQQELTHFLSHGNLRASTQLTLTKYLLNEWINEAIDVKEHCKCQVCHYYFIFSLFFKAILKTGFPGSSWPPAMHMPGVCSGTNPVPAPRSYIAGLLVGDSWESGRVSCDKQITSGCTHQKWVLQ